MPSFSSTKKPSYLSRLKSAFFKCTLLLVICMVMLIGGALVFLYIEHCYDIIIPPDPEQDHHELCKYITANYSSIILNDTIIQAKCDPLKNYQKEKIECEINKKTMGKFFDLVTSIGYTVGYGYITPLSNTGRIFFMVYVMPCISIVMASYMVFGEIITIFTEIIVFAIRKQCFNIHHKRHIKAHKLFVHIIFYLALWFGTSAIHKIVYTQYTWLECFYYATATITTVGFGDYPYISIDYMNAGLQYIVLGALLFMFSMGTLASVIGELNDMIMEKASKNTRTFSKMKQNSPKDKQTKSTVITNDVIMKHQEQNSAPVETQQNGSIANLLL